MHHLLLCLLLAIVSVVQVASDATQNASPLFSSSSYTPPPATPLSLDTPLTRFHFASCNRQDRAQPLWPVMEKREQQMFVWLGDVVYADKYPLSERASIFAQQLANPGYKSYLSHTPLLLGVYDDHDYGENDGDSTYEDRLPSKHHFLDFIGESKESPRRLTEHEGIYASYIYGPVGQRTKLILLDSRYNQAPGYEDDMLGAQQFAWLKREIDASDDIGLYILTSGVQFVSTDKRIGEGWRLKPKSRAAVMRAFALRQKNRDAAVMILSGDVHIAEADVTYSCEEVASSTEAASPSTTDPTIRVTPFYDFTSSGMTHAIGSQFTHTVVNMVFPLLLDNRTSYAEELDSSQSIRGYYAGINFGEIDIDWQRREVEVKIVSVDGQAHLSYKLPFSTLSAQVFTNSTLPSIIRQKCALEHKREHSPPMFTIAGARFVRTLILVGKTIPVVLMLLLMWYAKRRWWDSRRKTTVKKWD